MRFRKRSQIMGGKKRKKRERERERERKEKKKKRTDKGCLSGAKLHEARHVGTHALITINDTGPHMRVVHM